MLYSSQNQNCIFNALYSEFLVMNIKKNGEFLTSGAEQFNTCSLVLLGPLLSLLLINFAMKILLFSLCI